MGEIASKPQSMTRLVDGFGEILHLEPFIYLDTRVMIFAVSRKHCMLFSHAPGGTYEDIHSEIDPKPY